MVGNISERRLSGADELALKRLAIQIAAQLPSDPRHALAALDFARELVGGFLTIKAERQIKPTIALVKP